MGELFVPLAIICQRQCDPVAALRLHLPLRVAGKAVLLQGAVGAELREANWYASPVCASVNRGLWVRQGADVAEEQTKLKR